MCPADCEFILVTDRKSKAKAEALLRDRAPCLKANVIDVSDVLPDTQLDNFDHFNAMLKSPELWKQMPHEQLLIIQTDSLLSRPLSPFFFEFPYLGAPFIPRQHSEYYETRRKSGNINGFFKADTPIHNSPNPDVYPHLHGNGDSQ